MSTVTRLPNHGYQLYTKGASEIVLEKYVMFCFCQLFWNQIPTLFCQPHPNHSPSHSSHSTHASSSLPSSPPWAEFHSMLVKRIAVYLSSTVYERDIGRKLQLFPTHLHLTPPLGVIPFDDLRDFWWASCRMARL